MALSTRDADLGVTVFEQLPDGRLFHLAYWLGRASFAQDNTVRHLLTPGQPTRIPFETNVMSRRLSGKDVSAESIADAKQPVRVRWYTDSHITVPFA